MLEGLGRSRRKLAWLALLACAALHGCGDGERADEPPPDNSALRTSKTSPPPQLSPEERRQATQGRTPPKGPRPVDPSVVMERGTQAEAAEEAVAQEKPRDYSAELLSAVRGADSCVKPRTAAEGALPPELDIALEGLVLESGAVVTGSARSPALTPEELQCVKSRLESTRLPPGVKHAPRRVSATLKLKGQRQPAGGAPAPAGPAPAAPSAY